MGDSKRIRLKTDSTAIQTKSISHMAYQECVETIAQDNSSER